ncbi:MAG TPA: preprotein translocase subunit YajC [Anaeromyxobacter sp.]|nr:preprotein translocase subunit YajC [Anaeromyxobacter sp.]
MFPHPAEFLSQTAPDGGQGGGLESLVKAFGFPLVAMVAIFYLLVWRPQARERKRVAEWLAGMKKGDEVVTQSGIIGTVHLVEDRVVTLDIGGGNKLRVLKSQVVSAWKQAEPAAPAKAEARK